MLSGWNKPYFQRLTYDGCQISAHLLNKWKHKKESCGGWLFWGAFIALSLRAACVVWFVERLKWGWLVEQGLALDLHTLLNHTDSWLPALPTTPPQTQIYLHAGALPKSEPYGRYNTQPSAQSPAPGRCWQWWMLHDDSLWNDLRGQDCSRGYWNKPPKKRAGKWWQRGSEEAAGQVAIVCGAMDKSPWLREHKDSLRACLPEDCECFSFNVGKQLCVWINLHFACVHVRAENAARSL